MSKKFIATFLAVAVLLMMGLSRVDAAKTPVSKADKAFLDSTAQVGVAEITLGKLAAKRSSNPKIKSFGEHMVSEHTKMNQDLQKVATAKGVKVPNVTDAKHIALIAKLEVLTGTSFDKAYAEAMVKGHQDALASIEHEAKTTQDADIKALCQRAIPHIKEHLKMAQALTASK